MKILVVIDSFKGCITSNEANMAAADGIKAADRLAEVTAVNVSDGGEGWLTAWQDACGGRLVRVNAVDALLRPVTGEYIIDGSRAVIEIARVCGLAQLSRDELQPVRASSYGVGLLVADAVKRGCRNIIVGLGGSATSDCGVGMLKALVDSFAPDGTIDDAAILKEVTFTIATDVDNPLCGDRGAAYVFAPQKGASPSEVEQIERRAVRFAKLSAKHFGYDRQRMAGAGAAGGLGYAFMQYLNATRVSGAELLLDAAGFDEMLQGTSIVITGEGRADRQTLMGKLPFAILHRCKRRNVPVALLAGQVADRTQLIDAGFSRVECINPPTLSYDDAMLPDTAVENIRETVMGIINDL